MPLTFSREVVYDEESGLPTTWSVAPFRLLWSLTSCCQLCLFIGAKKALWIQRNVDPKSCKCSTQIRVIWVFHQNRLLRLIKIVIVFNLWRCLKLITGQFCWGERIDSTLLDTPRTIGAKIQEPSPIYIQDVLLSYFSVILLGHNFNFY